MPKIKRMTVFIAGEQVHVGHTDFDHEQKLKLIAAIEETLVSFKAPKTPEEEEAEFIADCLERIKKAREELVVSRSVIKAKEILNQFSLAEINALKTALYAIGYKGRV